MQGSVFRGLRADDVDSYITHHFAGIHPISAWGERSYFYNPGLQLKRGVYFATIKEKNGANDRASNLDREGVWRLNIGIRKQTFMDRFGQLPARPAKGHAIDGPWDFSAFDVVTPHPVYGWMAWIAVVCPTVGTFETYKLLLNDAYRRASEGFANRIR